MITEKISNSGVLSGTINASSNLTMGIGSSNNLVGGNINTFTKEIDPTIPDYIKAISKEDIAGWDNNAVVNEEQNKTLIGLEELIDTITPKNTAKGELVHITDALGLPTFETKTSGNVKQETTKGQQLYDYEDTTKVTEGCTTDEDGWITLTYDNTNGTQSMYPAYFTNDLNLKTNTTYTIVTEIKSVSGNGVFYPCSMSTGNPQTQGQFPAQPMYSFNKLNNNEIQINRVTTLETFDQLLYSYGLRTMTRFNVGESGSITFRLSVIEDTSVTADNFVYEKFTGGQASPNPEYPQEIEVIEGDLSFKVNGKNLIDTQPKLTQPTELTVKRQNDGKILLNGTASELKFLTIVLLENINIPAGTYTLSVKDNLGNEYAGDLYINGVYSYKNDVRKVIKQETRIKKIMFSIYLPKKTYTNTSIGIQLELGEVTTDYEPYQEQIVPLDLKGNWVGKINDDIKDYLVTDKRKYWLVKNVGKVVLDGSEEWIKSNFSTGESYYQLSLNIGQIISNVKNTVLCTHFIEKETWSKKVVGIYFDSKMIITTNDSLNNTETIDDFKTFLSENKPEVYYQLATPEIIELGELPEPIKTFEGVNNIQLLANLDTEIEVKYALDLKKYADDRYLELTNALVSTGANL